MEQDEIRIEVWGPFACFTRPDLKVERVSYDMMTPSAARNIIQCIYWHPGVRIQVTEIELMSPIKHLQVMRNEVKSKASASTVFAAAKKNRDVFIDADQEIMQRSAIILKDVHYCIHVKLHMTAKANPSDSVEKFKAILLRRARSGQCYMQPVFGCREFPAYFRLVELHEDIRRVHETKDLGLMLYDMDYKDNENIQPMFFFAKLDDGRMHLRNVKIMR